MLNPDTGWINVFLKALGIEHPPDWLHDPTWIYPGLVIMGVWGIGAGMIVYLAGLKGIPTELYEAARIDGAGAWASLRNITIPMISPVIFYTLVLGVVEVLQYFLVPLVLKNGHRRAGRRRRSSSTSTSTRTSSRSRTCPTARRSPGSCSSSRWSSRWSSSGRARRWVYYAGEAR